jgi:hypothetical protein
VQPIAADVDQLAGRGIAARISWSGDRLVAGPGQRQDRDKSDQRGQTAADPAQYPPPPALGGDGTFNV